MEPSQCSGESPSGDELSIAARRSMRANREAAAGLPPELSPARAEGGGGGMGQEHQRQSQHAWAAMPASCEICHHRTHRWFD